MGGVRLHAGVRRRAHHRREPGRPVRAQAPLPARRRYLRAGQPVRGPVGVRAGADHRPRRPGRRRGRHDAAGARHIPGHLRRGGAGQGVRDLRRDARLRVRGRPAPGRRADRGEPVRLELALGLLRQRARGRRRADRRPALRARDKGSGRPPPGRSRRRAAGRLAGRHRLPAAGGPPARLARLDLAAARRWPGRPGRAQRPRG